VNETARQTLINLRAKEMVSNSNTTAYAQLKTIINLIFLKKKG
jgi:hypothetical protein